jgi:hypothetical protein
LVCVCIREDNIMEDKTQESTLKFRPLIVGGIIACALGSVTYYFDYKYQLLLVAVAILVS